MLIPEPVKTVKSEGYFKISGHIKIVLDSLSKINNLNCAESLKKDIEEYTGVVVPFTKAFVPQKNDTIILKIKDGKHESYSIDITKCNVTVTGSDDAGLFYGVQTLRQIVKLNKNTLPCMHIEDYPYFKVRGYYHDVTRGKVPTLDTLKELCDRLSYYKINQMQLYIEHSFAFSDETEVWSGNTPLTPEDILYLDEYCSARHVELVPSISLFGHLYEVLRSESFNELCELGKDSSEYSWINRQLHHTLDVFNPKSIEFVEKRISEFLPLFSSNKFNICCDETFDVGQGKNKAVLNKTGQGKLYVDFLNEIIDCARKYNKEIMFWDDIILKQPEYLKYIPQDITCLTWDYSADVKEDSVKAISESGHSQYVCPGVAGWNCIMNNMNDASSNIRKMVSYGKKYNAEGILNTDWGDFGHVNLFGNSTPGMILGAALSWNPDSNLSDSDFDKQVSETEYGEPSKTLVSYLRQLGSLSPFNWAAVVVWKEGKSGRYPVGENYKALIQAAPGEFIEGAYIKALDIEDKLLSLYSKVDKDRQLDMKEFISSAVGTALLNALCLVIKKYDFKQDVKTVCEPNDLAEQFELWFCDYEKLWRARNKESELFRIKDTIKGVCKILRNYK